MLQWHGVEGYHYTIEGGEVRLTDRVKNHAEGSYSVVHDGGLKGGIPTVVTRDIAYSEQSARGIKTVAMIERNEAEIYPYVIKPYPSIMATKEEAETMARLLADINTYRDEMVVKVFLGEMDIDDMWDVYVKTLKDLGIDEVVAIKQAQLDRVQ
jgi:putative aldouronate transport system substrate-binding protein